MQSFCLNVSSFACLFLIITCSLLIYEQNSSSTWLPVQLYFTFFSCYQTLIEKAVCDGFLIAKEKYLVQVTVDVDKY